MASIVVVPTYVRSESDLDITMKTLDTLKEHEPDVDVLIVDDCSPEQDLLAETVYEWMDSFDSYANLVLKDENEGFSRAVNVGLQRALDEGKDAILCNADMEFIRPIVGVLEDTLDEHDEPAPISGALLLYDTGLIQHAGIYFSFLTRGFDHRFRYGPAGLPEAHFRKICPVTGALQFIRHSTIEKIGLYDPEYRMGFEDVDYCLRAFGEGLSCVYNPLVIAIHHESMFRGQSNEKLEKWQNESLLRLIDIHGSTGLGQFVPEIK